jgi:hypothetical protein
VPKSGSIILEADMCEIKPTLARLAPMIIRIDERLASTLPNLVTKAGTR